MSHRQPRLKDQAALLRKHLASKGMTLAQGESLELVSRLNGFPSWNVAKQAQAPDTATTSSALEVKLWVGVHHHRHGEDFFYFTHLPSEQEVIDRVNAASSFEEDLDEWVEVRGVETLRIDVPEALACQAARALPSGVIGVYEVCMTELFEYDTPDEIPEWQWVENQAAFAHRGNGVEGGVWEFMVHADKLRNGLDNVPELLRPEVDKALARNAAWVMFHQG